MIQQPPPPYEGSEPYIFVCYSHDDAALVYPELAWLDSEGFRYWYDEGIAPGEYWPEALAGAIEGATVFLMFISRSAVDSEFCLRESTFAFGRQKSFVAIYLEETTLPRGLELIIGDRQAILRHKQDELRYREKVIGALEQHVERRRDPEHAIQDPEPAIRVPKTAASNTMAVLPFRLLTPSPGEEYLCTALADALIGKLATIPNLDVLPWVRVAQYAGQSTDALGIARELGVQMIVDASIQKLGAELRIHVQAISVEGQVVSAARHEGTMTSLFSLQDAIADQLLSDLGIEMQARPEVSSPTNNPAAYELYLQGTERLNQYNIWDTRTGIEMLRNATSLDPDFTEAWGRLAEAIVQMAFTFEPEEHWFRAAEQAIHNALELDPTNASAHYANGRLLWSPANGYRNRPALRSLARAMRFDPTADQARIWQALIFMHVGLLDEARTNLQAAIVRVPEDPMAGFFLAHLDHYERDHEAAIAGLDQGLLRHPANYYIHVFYPLITLYAGDLAATETRIAAAEQFAPNDPMILSIEGLLWAKRGEEARALEAITRAQAAEVPVIHRHHIGHNAASVYAVLGQTDKALPLLREIVADGLPNYPVFDSDPHFKNLHGLPEFNALMSELELDWQEFKTEFGGK
ncbi:MAG: TIR domain-containing protein [Gammaproteobacteria bacterium]|nr:MAG: TIR domain-containing protein [Gammaproteobacteria bacterium]